MLRKCGHFTQKDKDTGGTMRERINRLARGIIDNGSPELVLAPERVEASVPAGEVIRDCGEQRKQSAYQRAGVFQP